MREDVKKYIASIRNAEKKRYAVDYFYGKAQDRSYNLGGMAKQAVEMTINAFFPDEEEERGELR